MNPIRNRRPAPIRSGLLRAPRRGVRSLEEAESDRAFLPRNEIAACDSAQTSVVSQRGIRQPEAGEEATLFPTLCIISRWILLNNHMTT